MSRKFVLFVLLCIAALSSIQSSFALPQKKGKGKISADSVAVDSVAKAAETINDTTKMDSLQKSIWKYNKAIDDSLRLDSLNMKRKNGVDAPVVYSAKDSLVYYAKTRVAHLYGDSKVQYQNMDLSSAKVQISVDSSIVRATGAIKDTLGTIDGKPIFKMGSDSYDLDTLAFNFKTKKGLIHNTYTQQAEGYMRSEKSKRMDNGEVYIQHGKYTTCDEPHPDFYISLSRAKVRPGKDVVFGPAYLVVADVPLPLAVPYGFFPFTKKNTSGFIMPTYGDETERGFYLRNGGYYFALSDKFDLKLLGEIFTKGSWGVSGLINYKKRYRYSGTFNFSYQNSQTGEKNMPDFSRTTSFKLQWSHRQDAKANPYSSLSASVNYATTAYEKNNLTSLYNPQALSQTTRTSSVSWSTTFSSIGLSLSATMNANQNMRDSTVSLTLPDLNISISRFYPFKRKKAVGDERWYEKISMSYTGSISNSISTKENQIMHSNLIKDWKNGMKHSIPISGNFTVLGYLNLNPSFTFTDRTYSSRVKRSWDEINQVELADTTYGFYNVYDWSLSFSASTKMYGFYTPTKWFNKILKDKLMTVRHVFTPTVSVSYAPDFSTDRYGYYDSYLKTDANGNVSLVNYSPYSTGLYGVPGKGRTGNISMDISNNIEMKLRSDKDSSGYKKISIIDELGASLSYNAAADSRPWSDLSTRLRLKWWKNYTFSLNAVFATYAYELDANGKPYVGTHTEWGKGRFGRFQGMSQNFSFTIDNSILKKIRKLFHPGEDDDDDDKKNSAPGADDIDTNIESNIDDKMVEGQRGAKNSDEGKAETDEDGYKAFSIPWSVSVGYGITMRENTSGNFNTETMRYPYKFTQTLNISGNIRISDGWNISFSSGYDFEDKKPSMTTASLGRDLHCFSMSCSLVLYPYTSYNFSFRCKASTLTDALKYDKNGSSNSAIKWY